MSVTGYCQIILLIVLYEHEALALFLSEESVFEVHKNVLKGIVVGLTCS
jgi:hypothetical protein